MSQAQKSYDAWMMEVLRDIEGIIKHELREECDGCSEDQIIWDAFQRFNLQSSYFARKTTLETAKEILKSCKSFPKNWTQKGS